ncbi:MAG: hypothetical protein LC774_07000, partial [Acidobacteria bacterium]|nr:hypothetical protein [Acidobacteriota bacterium]
MDDVLLRCANQNTEVGGKVLVISPDLDVRSRYCDLYVQSNPLDNAYPGSRMLPTGDIISLQRDRDITHSNGVCFFLPGLQLPKKIYFTPSMILLDLRYARWSKRSLDLVSWATKIKGKAGLLALYSIGDRDTYSALNKNNFIDLPFDHAAIATCIERVQRHSSPQKELSVDWRIGDAPAYLKRKHEIIKIQNGDSVSELVSKLGGLLDEHSRVESPDLNRARWLLAMFSQIPVPLVWYEQAARSLGRSTLRRMISYLGIKSRHLQGLGAVMQTLR